MGPDALHDLSQPLVHGPGVGLPPLSARDVHIQGPVKIVEIQQRPAAYGAVGKGHICIIIQNDPPLKLFRPIGVVVADRRPGQQVPQGAAVALLLKEGPQLAISRVPRGKLSLVGFIFPGLAVGAVVGVDPNPLAGGEAPPPGSTPERE